MIKGLLNRLRSDYFLSNRVRDYEEIISKALDAGYEIMSHSHFYQLVLEKDLHDRKIMLIRHDIDTDPEYCRYWLEVERKYGVKTSYFFRLCTVNIPIMKAVIEQGSDCGYHYEELATYAKRMKIKSPDELTARMGAIQDEFRANLSELERDLGHKIKYIASHGDFANRKLGLPNHVIVDKQLMEDTGVLFETYQHEFIDNYSINISDCGFPAHYRDAMNPLNSLGRHKIIHLLVHPRHWRSSIYWNSYENLKRLIEGIRF